MPRSATVRMISRIWSVEIQGMPRCAASAAAMVDLPTVGAPPSRYFVPLPISPAHPRESRSRVALMPPRRNPTAGACSEPPPEDSVDSENKSRDAQHGIALEFRSRPYRRAGRHLWRQLPGCDLHCAGRLVGVRIGRAHGVARPAELLA